MELRCNFEYVCISAQLLRSDRLLKVYFACVLLRNCHVALYGGIESNYFDNVIPEDMLERYLNQS